MSIVATLPVFVLSNSYALNGLLAKDCLTHCQDADAYHRDWEDWVRVASFQRDSTRPGHVFDMRWAKFRKEGHAFLVKALDCLGAEFLMVHNQRLYIKELSQFSYWQNLRGRMSMLPVKCRMLYSRKLTMRDLLVHPMEAILDEYIEKEGLNEAHLHLHTCQRPEISWLLHIGDIARFEQQELKDSNANKRLYAAAHPELTPERMIQRVRLANVLRRVLLELVDGGCNKRCVEEMKEAYLTMVKNSECKLTEGVASFIVRDARKLLREELMLWEGVFSWIQESKPQWREVQFFAHLYLLIKNEYLNLFRHNEWRRGFRSFQMVSHHKSPWISCESYYRETFRNLFLSSGIRHTTKIELRLTPDIFIKRAKLLLQWWKEEWAEYRTTRNRVELSQYEFNLDRDENRWNYTSPKPVFVLHFIKNNKENPEAYAERESQMDRERYMKKRRALYKECFRLTHFIKSFYATEQVAVGIDAAGDELQLPVDVIAPVFRLFERETGISHRTYHCGEDFYHLLGGIRAVYDAVYFLDMQCGHRLGHATAIGIHPSQWRKSMPARLCVPRGEYLLDLIFASKVLAESNLKEKNRVEAELLRHARHIFPEPALSVHDLHDFFETRHFVPERVRDFPKDWRHYEPADEEDALVKKHYEEWGGRGLNLLDLWNFNAEVYEAAAELVEIECGFMDDSTLIQLQQAVQRLISERNVVLETLPVSNLRISQYEDIRQHHLLRWLGVPGSKVPGDYPMSICMGSDDPGIFVTDIKNEYYHIFANLRQIGLSPAECMVYIKRLNEAGSAYAFRSISPPPDL